MERHSVPIVVLASTQADVGSLIRANWRIMELIISPPKANSQTRNELAEEGKEKKKREAQSLQ